MFSEQLKGALLSARDEAHRLRHPSIGPEHLALGLVHEPRHELSVVLPADQAPALSDALLAAMDPGTAPAQWVFDIPYSPRAKLAIKHMVSEAKVRGHAEVSCAHLLFGVLCLPERMPRAVFESVGVTAEVTRAALGARDD
jgi:ATP-dependent Clp protease ATP-binding subunit ClpC